MQPRSLTTSTRGVYENDSTEAVGPGDPDSSVSREAQSSPDNPSGTHALRSDFAIASTRGGLHKQPVPDDGASDMDAKRPRKWRARPEVSASHQAQETGRSRKLKVSSPRRCLCGVRGLFFFVRKPRSNSPPREAGRGRRWGLSPASINQKGWKPILPARCGEPLRPAGRPRKSRGCCARREQRRSVRWSR